MPKANAYREQMKEDVSRIITSGTKLKVHDEGDLVLSMSSGSEIYVFLHDKGTHADRYAARVRQQHAQGRYICDIFGEPFLEGPSELRLHKRREALSYLERTSDYKCLKNLLHVERGIWDRNQDPVLPYYQNGSIVWKLIRRVESIVEKEGYKTTKIFKDMAIAEDEFEYDGKGLMFVPAGDRLVTVLPKLTGTDDQLREWIDGMRIAWSREERWNMWKFAKLKGK